MVFVAASEVTGVCVAAVVDPECAAEDMFAGCKASACVSLDCGFEVFLNSVQGSEVAPGLCGSMCVAVGGHVSALGAFGALGARGLQLLLLLLMLLLVSLRIVAWSVGGSLLK